jgi:peptide deformylase
MPTVTIEIEVPPEIRKIWDERGGPIVKYPDPVLNQPAKAVTRHPRELRELVDSMKEAMHNFSGVGLAAPQMGVLERVFIYKLPEEGEPLRVVINPKIVSAKGEQIGPEGCLSIPLLQGDVKRAMEVVVKGTDILGRPFRRRATEFEARVIQHEIDHLDGVLFIEKADPETLHWLTPQEKDDGEEDDPEMRE